MALTRIRHRNAVGRFCQSMAVGVLTVGLALGGTTAIVHAETSTPVPSESAPAVSTESPSESPEVTVPLDDELKEQAEFEETGPAAPEAIKPKKQKPTETETAGEDAESPDTNSESEAPAPESKSVTIAAVAPGISGTIRVDTDKNGVVGSATEVGTDEPGLSGVALSVVCAADTSIVLGSTVTDANGGYVFDSLDFATSCASGEVYVTLSVDEVANNHYFVAAATGTDNGFPRNGASAQTGRSAQLTLTTTSDIVLDGLVQPNWTLDLLIPVDGGSGQPAVFTGSAPFDTGCPEAGLDCAATDNLVRTADKVTYTWSVSASSEQSLGSGTNDVVLEQTLNLGSGTVATFEGIPARCTPSGGGGTSPASSVKSYPSGTTLTGGAYPPASDTSVVLSCNVGNMGDTAPSAITLQPVVKISSKSSSGSDFTTTARAYSVDPTSVPTAKPAESVDHGPIEITAAPRYDLRKTSWQYATPSARTIDGVSVPGYYIYAHIAISTDRKSGVEAFQQPVTITENVWALDGVNNQPFDGLEYYLTACGPNVDAFPHTVGGYYQPNGVGNFGNPNALVSNSGNCAINRTDTDTSSPYELTFNGIDTSGDRYPTQTAGGTDLTSGPYYVASYQIQVFIPSRSIDLADGVANSDGSINLFNKVGGFDPVSVSGSSNYGSGFEPGYCDTSTFQDTHEQNCDAMPGGGRSNNVIGPVSLIVTKGNWQKAFINVTQMWNPSIGGLPGLSSLHAGNATVQPGEIYESRIEMLNQSTQDWSNLAACDVFDNTTLELVSSAEGTSGGNANIYAWIADSSVAQADRAADQANWRFEYAHVDFGSDDPIGGGFDNNTDRYNGDWTSQRSAGCDDDDAANGTWYTDATSVPGGLSAVNAVRVAAQPGKILESGSNAYVVFSLKQRESFNGGPNSGQSIPSGTVAANFGRVKADEWTNGNWTGRNYSPQPETGNVDGDRWTVQRATMALNSRSITVDGIGDGAANFGNTGSAVAGNKVVWEVTSSLSAVSDDPAPVENVTITDTLPKHVTYDASCTASITGGTVPTSVTVNPDGTTTLVWNLGTLTPNQPIAPRRICTDTDPLTPDNLSLVNRATITADGISPASSHSDTHTVILDQTGEVRLGKYVDAPVDLQNDDQVWTLTAQNFSETLTVAAPTIIEVFPYNGDDSVPGGVDRTPASDFSGSLALTGAPTAQNLGGAPVGGTFYYTKDDPSTINQNLNGNTTTWYQESQFGTAAAPANFGEVTAFKFVGSTNLGNFGTGDASGISVELTLQAGDPNNQFGSNANKSGDRYADRFTLFSDTFSTGGNYQLLTSNQVNVDVIGFSAGDTIWNDTDSDGKYTPGTDTVVPEGVTVQLWQLVDGTAAQVTSTETDADGHYLFDNLPQGTYFVQIPSAEFEPGGLLAGWRITSEPASSDINENDDVSHDAVYGEGLSVRSGEFTLAAEIDGVVITGSQPLNDNIHDIEDATRDDLSNLAIDFALSSEAGQLVVAKSFSGEGTTFATTPLEFSVVCSYNGVEYLDETIELTPDGSGSTLLSDPVTELRLGSECVVTETNSGGADETPAPVTVTIVENDDDNTVIATFVNAYSAGTIAAAKVLEGDYADHDDVVNREFTLQVTCQVATDGPDGDIRGTVYSGAVVIKGGQTVTIVDSNGGDVLLPLGAHCFAEETDKGGADKSKVDFDSFDNAVIVTGGAPESLQALTVTATNTFNEDPDGGEDPGTVTPTPSETAPPAPLADTGAGTVGAIALLAALLLLMGAAAVLIARRKKALEQ